MKTKQEVIAEITPHKQYLGRFVIEKINGISEVLQDVKRVETLKKGDVIRVAAGLKPRPGVVIRIKGDKVISIPLTTEEGAHSLLKSESRFFRDGWFCNSYNVTTLENAKNNFFGVYDNPRLVDEAVRALKLFMGEMFNLKRNDNNTEKRRRRKTLQRNAGNGHGNP